MDSGHIKRDFIKACAIRSGRTAEPAAYHFEPALCLSCVVGIESKNNDADYASDCICSDRNDGIWS